MSSIPTIIKIKRLPSAAGDLPPLPAYQTAHSAGLDLCAFTAEPITLAPSALTLIPTGLAIEIDPAYAALIYPRSGLATKHGITLSNCVGVVDSDYRGEIKVGLCNVSAHPYTIHPGDRIAQLLLQPVLQATIQETDELTPTVRGTGGFGSTGT